MHEPMVDRRCGNAALHSRRSATGAALCDESGPIDLSLSVR